MKELQFTLYEVFGYLLPGVVALSGVLIVFWAIYYPKSPLPTGPLNAGAYTALVVASYFAGHFVQAIANMTLGRFCKFEDELAGATTPTVEAELNRLATKAASDLLGIERRLLGPKFLHLFADEMIVQQGIDTEREIFQYREGFYRGATVSFALLSIGGLVRILVPGTALLIREATVLIPRSLQLFPLCLSIAAVLLMYQRYRRFGRYRAERTLGAFILLNRIRPRDGHLSPSGGA